MPSRIFSSSWLWNKSFLSIEHLVQCAIPLSRRNRIFRNNSNSSFRLYSLPCRFTLHQWRSNNSLSCKSLLPIRIYISFTLFRWIILSCWGFILFCMPSWIYLSVPLNQRKSNSLFKPINVYADNWVSRSVLVYPSWHNEIFQFSYHKLSKWIVESTRRHSLYFLPCWILLFCWS